MGQDLIKYEYHNGDVFYYLEEVRIGREKLSGKTFYKTKGITVTQVQPNNVEQRPNRQGVYLHEVEVKEKLADVFKTANGSTSPTSKLIISQLLAKIKVQDEKNLQISRKRSSEQINPVVVDGKVREEYADLLSERKYTVQTLKVLQGKALEWIKRNGGVKPSVQALLKDSAPADPAVAEIARRILLNSEVFAENVSRVDRTRLYELEQDTRSDWGRTGRAMQLAALKLNDVASVQAVLNKLHKDMKDSANCKNQRSLFVNTCEKWYITGI